MKNPTPMGKGVTTAPPEHNVWCELKATNIGSSFGKFFHCCKKMPPWVVRPGSAITDACTGVLYPSPGWFSGQSGWLSRVTIIPFGWHFYCLDIFFLRKENANLQHIYRDTNDGWNSVPSDKKKKIRNSKWPNTRSYINKRWQFDTAPHCQPLKRCPVWARPNEK